MKELSLEEKARAYDKALESMRDFITYVPVDDVARNYILSTFPELKESEDEEIRKDVLAFIRREGQHIDKYKWHKWIAWLEKQGENSIYKVPSKEVILAIWDLGNEWKELTNGIISTEQGTQLDYIQKHWCESEYYLREMQSEHKPADNVEAKPAEWSEEDWVYMRALTDTLKGETTCFTNKDFINWFESLKQRIGG